MVAIMAAISFLPLIVLILIASGLLALPSGSLHSSWPPWNVTPIPGLRLEATGLIALADLKTLLIFAAYHAGGSIFHSMWILPGLQAQQNVATIHQGDKPIAASLKTGRVTRVENPATIFYLHRISRMGNLIHVDVLPESLHPTALRGRRWWREVLHAFCNGLAVGPCLTLIAATLLFVSRDWWGLVVLGLLFCVRISNTVKIKRRVMEAWMGAMDEELTNDNGEDSDDVVVFLSLARWVRLRGSHIDINAVTVGKWLRDMHPGENLTDAANKLAVFVAAALTTNVTQLGSIIIALLLMISAGAMGLLNVSRKQELGMQERKLIVMDPPTPYKSRRHMVSDLIQQTGSDEWAIELGMSRKESSDVHGSIATLSV